VIVFVKTTSGELDWYKIKVERNELASAVLKISEIFRTNSNYYG
jgi:hypothetical protein